MRCETVSKAREGIRPPPHGPKLVARSHERETSFSASVPFPYPSSKTTSGDKQQKTYLWDESRASAEASR